ncbi:MAG: ribosome hibernation-promoting factor, HPF/YfiA family [Methylococcus sp.]
MQINITGQQLQVTESLRNYILEKFARLQRHSDRIMDAHVILQVEKLVQKAEATVNLQGGSVFAEENHEDMYAAIDGLVDKLDRQIVKRKEKNQNH